MMAPGHEIGFGLLANSAIDQHVNTRGREKDLDAVIATHPNLLGIGIDEQAAIIVHADSFSVVDGQVAIHDGKDHDGALYYFLSSGQNFNLRTRAIDSSADSFTTALNPATEKYPLTLTATSAMRTIRFGSTTTRAVGILSDQNDPTKPPLRVNLNATLACTAEPE